MFVCSSVHGNIKSIMSTLAIYAKFGVATLGVELGFYCPILFPKDTNKLSKQLYEFHMAKARKGSLIIQ